MYEMPAQAYVSSVADFERLQTSRQDQHLPVRRIRLDQIAQVHEAVEKATADANGDRVARMPDIRFAQAPQIQRRPG